MGSDRSFDRFCKVEQFVDCLLLDETDRLNDGVGLGLNVTDSNHCVIFSGWVALHQHCQLYSMFGLIEFLESLGESWGRDLVIDLKLLQDRVQHLFYPLALINRLLVWNDGGLGF